MDAVLAVYFNNLTDSGSRQVHSKPFASSPVDNIFVSGGVGRSYRVFIENIPEFLPKRIVEEKTTVYSLRMLYEVRSLRLDENPLKISKKEKQFYFMWFLF